MTDLSSAQPPLPAPGGLAAGPTQVLSAAAEAGRKGRRWVGLHRAADPRLAQYGALAGEALGAVLTGIVLAMLVERLSTVGAAGLGVWVVAVYHRGYTAISPLQSSLTGPARALGLVMALGGGLAALGAVGPEALAGLLLATAGATAVAVGTRVLRHSRRPVRTLVVGDPDEAADFVTELSGAKSSQIVSTCMVGPQPDEDAGKAGAGLLAKVDRAVSRYHVDSVVLVPGGNLSGTALRRLTWGLERRPVHVAITPCSGAIAPHRVRPGRVGGRTVLEVEPTRRSAYVRSVKALLDRSLGGVLLVLASPVILLLGLLVRLDSRGPAIFRQTRVGLHGREFTMYKLRTMCSDAEKLRIPLQRQQEEDRMLFKLADDPRITRVGRLLRRSSLDELPQLINVVKGDMSLIGPRPALPEEVAKYDDRARRRLALRPGLSGLWQVSGRSDLSWDESLALDLHYVDNWRLTDDALILARTAHAVIASRGAY